MAELELRLDKENKQLYLKKPVLRAIGKGKNVKCLTGVDTALLHPDNIRYKDILPDLDVLRSDLILRDRKEKDKRRGVKRLGFQGKNTL